MGYVFLGLANILLWGMAVAVFRRFPLLSSSRPDLHSNVRLKTAQGAKPPGPFFKTSS
jgi:hypothetical protein